MAKPGTHLDRLRVRARGLEVLAGAEVLVSLVLHGRQLVGEGGYFDGFRDTHVGRLRWLCASECTRHRHLESFSNLPARVNRHQDLRIQREAKPMVLELFLRHGGSRKGRKNLLSPFLPVRDLSICGAPPVEHYHRRPAHGRLAPWRQPPQVSRRSRPNLRRPGRDRRPEGVI